MDAIVWVKKMEGGIRRQSYSTVLVGPSGMLDGVSRLLDQSDFHVVASAASVDRLPLSNLPQHEAVLLILDAGSDVETTWKSD